MLQRVLYTGLAGLMLPIFCAVLWWRGLRGNRGYWRDFSQRFGFGPKLDQQSVWVHGVSFGEVQAASALVHALRQKYPDLPLVVTTGTPTGADHARKLFARDRVHVCYIPFDLPGPVRRFMDRTKPAVVVIFETEVWPNIYHACWRRGVPLVLASARISPRSVSRYRWMGKLFRETLSRVVVGAQSEQDAARFREVGADPARTHVTGNIKFDFLLPAATVGRGTEIRRRQAAGRATWIAGSTHAGEEEAVLEAHRAIRREHPDALLAMAPRHPQRFSEVAQWLEGEGVRFVRHSRGEVCTSETEVLLVDTLGELLDFYAACDVAFVGGSLVPIGGHNLLEPAALGVPVLAGPYNDNSQDIAQLLLARGAMHVVRTPTELAAEVSVLLRDVAARVRMGGVGKAVVDENRGALKKLLALIEPLLRWDDARQR